jgi:hypothetical protein
MLRFRFPVTAVMFAAALTACSDHGPSTPLQPPAQRVAARPASAFQGVVGGRRVQPGANDIDPQHFQIPCTGGEKVLLIEVTTPWAHAPGQDARGADVTELKARRVPFCTIPAFQIGTIDLSNFRVVMIASAQTQRFYDNLFPRGTIHPRLVQFVRNGGILSANLADCASGPGNGGGWASAPCGADETTSYTFVGGVKHVNSFPDDNNIAAPRNPIITGAFGGRNGGRIVDVGTFDDLDGWNSSSHGYFVNLPGSTTVILRDDSGQPVMVSYPFGSGVVFATLTTIEWRYVGGFGGLPQNKKLLANEFGTQLVRGGVIR